LNIGLDIGGTKCALSTGESEGGAIKILSREEFPTAGLSWQQVLEEFAHRIDCIVSSNSNSDLQLSSIGISCGGPLDSKQGIIMSPPNLPGWDDVPVVKFFEERFRVPTAVQNDANACALAEYLYGSGRGVKNFVFMTFGTGLGAGIIIDGKLYSGTNDNAGEIGHIRLAPTGPVYQAGTLSGNPVAMAAGLAQLEKLERLQAEEGVYAELERKGALLADGLRAGISAAGTSASVNQFGSVCTLFFTEGPVTSWESASASDHDAFAAYFRFMLEAGFLIAPSQFEALFVSVAHTDEDIVRFVDAATAALAAMQSQCG